MKVTVAIDGREGSVERGTTLLAAARKLGIDIPTLCHHDALEPYGSCRLCLVEVSRGGRSRLTTACNYPVLHEGETVSTDSQGVRNARGVVMELLLARCPTSAPVRAMAERLGVAASRFPAPAPSRLAAADAALVDCILCGLCVRVCAESIGASAIGFAERGPNRRVAAPFLADAAACIGCGACAAVCPTKAITIEDDSDGLRRIPFLATSLRLRRCARCWRFFAPEPQLERLSASAARPHEPSDACPDCRRRSFGGQLARWVSPVAAAGGGERP